MADFTAVLRKTLDGLGETTPEMRAKVFDKARSAIRKKLDAIDPPPSQSVVDRQMQSLEKAITEIESDYSVADEPLDDLDRLLSQSSDDSGSRPTPTKAAVDNDPVTDPASDDTPAVPRKPSPLSGTGEAMGRVGARKKSSLGMWLLVVILLLIAAGAAAWIRSDLVEQYTGIDVKSLVDPGEKMMEPPKAEPEKEPEPGKGPEVIKPAEPEKPQPENADTGEPQKFTQRLTADGKEIDPGPAAGEPTVGEGRSVAAAQPADPATATEPEPADTGTGQPQQVVVGQKALLYEEGSGGAQGTADAGGVVWSVVREEPADGQAAEPAIRGELTIPEKDIRLTVTIRRNGDKTLPASHLIELYFQLPDGYGGGGVAEMTRVSLKESEQATGSPLLGVPARISDEFYLVALTDAEAAIDTNLALLRRQSWIDIPVSYLSGRRALFTLEKGVPGEKVFNEVIKAWEGAGSG